MGTQWKVSSCKVFVFKLDNTILIVADKESCIYKVLSNTLIINNAVDCSAVICHRDPYKHTIIFINIF